MFFIKSMDKAAAKEISKWKYDAPFSMYSMEENDECIDELMCGAYYSVSNEDNNIIGFYCFGKAAQVPQGNEYDAYEDRGFLDMGLGMRPELCGKGSGLEFVNKEIEFAKALFSRDKLRLTVADSNSRAVSVYEKAGFKKVMAFNRTNEKGTTRFNIMTLE